MRRKVAKIDTRSEFTGNIGKTKLLIINYSMNSSNPVFAHQIGVTREIAKYFKEVRVLTHEYSGELVPSNVDVEVSAWQVAHNFRNVWRFFLTFFRLLITFRPNVIFSHMTEVQSSLIAPITCLLRIQHYLWYAHRSKSKYLLFCKYLVTGIITSTPGSCPLIGKRINAIGQAIDSTDFPFQARDNFKPALLRIIHIGRVDPSKQIEKLISVVSSPEFSHRIESLTIVGSPTPSYKGYLDQIKTLTLSSSSPRILIEGPLSRGLIPHLLSQFDLFIHAYEGSLDKSLVEATMTGIPVVTVNPEYLQHIGGWKNSYQDSLETELRAFFSKSNSEIQSEVVRRLEIVKRNHSLDSWTLRLVAILKGDK